MIYMLGHVQDKFLGVPFPTVSWIGIDWADQAPAVRVQAVGSDQVEACDVVQRPEALQDRVRQRRAGFPQGYLAVPARWLPDGAVASGVQNCRRKQAGGMYTAMTQDAKMEIPVNSQHELLPSSPAVAPNVQGYAHVGIL
jgi:hypothetical protein